MITMIQSGLLTVTGLYKELKKENYLQVCMILRIAYGVKKKLGWVISLLKMRKFRERQREHLLEILMKQEKHKCLKKICSINM